MNDFQRYAIYYLPSDDLAEFGAGWLGWDVDRGREVAMPEGVSPLTETPRKYGFHGTLKPPFRLAEGTDADGLLTASRALAKALAPVTLEAMTLARLGSFFALVPAGNAAELGTLAGACVRELDGFRAPAGDAELARRRAKGLSPVQEEMLVKWGYPYVFEEFKFHLTLTGRVPKADRDAAQTLIETHLPVLPRPFVIDAIGLVGERSDGRFETIERLPLGL